MEVDVLFFILQVRHDGLPKKFTECRILKEDPELALPHISGFSVRV